MFAGGGMGKRTHASYGASEEPPPGGDGGGGTNTSMLGHLDTTIRSAPVPVLTEAELDAADEAETLDSTLMEQLQTVRRRGTSRKLNSFAIVMDPQCVQGVAVMSYCAHGARALGRRAREHHAGCACMH